MLKPLQNKKSQKKRPLIKRQPWKIIPALLLGFIAIVSALGIYVVRHEHREAGQFNVSDIYIGENLFRSLDLNLAVKASYPSSPLSVARDFGSPNGLHQQLFKYNVKNDGLTEYGLMITPASRPPAAGYPTLILLHGYSNPKRYSTTVNYLEDMEFYARQGFLVVKPDLRGQGYSEEAGTADSAYYSMAYNTDIMSLISALKLTSYVDKSNINIWGHSMGAYIGLRAAVLSKDIKNLILLAGPVDSLKEMYLTYIPPSDENNPYALATRNSVFAKYGTPAEDSRFWAEASPINFVGRLKANVQIHVGLLDSVVSPEFSADLNTALAKAHVSHQYFAYPDGRHSLVPERADIYSSSLQLMLPKPVTPAA